MVWFISSLLFIAFLRIQDDMSENRRHWHLDKGFSVSHLFATVTLIIGGVTYATDLASNVNENRLEITHVKETNKQVDSKVDSVQKDVKSLVKSVTRIEALLEQRSNN